MPAFLRSPLSILAMATLLLASSPSAQPKAGPLVQQDHPKQVRILEIYASRAAYEAHLQTPHFQHYKTATLGMVKSLKLVDMTAMDDAAMARMFKKAP